MKFFVLAAFSLVLTFAASDSFAKSCKTGKACGNTCIAKDAVCSKEAPKHAKTCKKGKACGDTCIAQDAVCSKDAPEGAPAAAPAASEPAPGAAHEGH